MFFFKRKIKNKMYNRLKLLRKALFNVKELNKFPYLESETYNALGDSSLSVYGTFESDLGDIDFYLREYPSEDLIIFKYFDIPTKYKSDIAARPNKTALFTIRCHGEELQVVPRMTPDTLTAEKISLAILEIQEAAKAGLGDLEEAENYHYNQIKLLKGEEND